MAQNGSYMQVRDAQSGRLQGWMFVSQASRKYDAVVFAARVVPPRLASWRDSPAADPISSLRFYAIALSFKEFKHASGRIERVLANPGYSMEQLESTFLFWQADEEDE